jgi:hypothetical protein
LPLHRHVVKNFRLKRLRASECSIEFTSAFKKVSKFSTTRSTLDRTVCGQLSKSRLSLREALPSSSANAHSNSVFSSVLNSLCRTSEPANSNLKIVEPKRLPQTLPYLMQVKDSSLLSSMIESIGSKATLSTSR